MPRVLNQQEIDSLLEQAKRKQSSSPAAPARHVQPWNAREAGQLASSQARSLSGLHEHFARNLTHTLGAYLRVSFGASPISVEQFVFEEFVSSIPELAYITAFQMEPFDVGGLIQLEQALLFPMVDVLLGGNGDPNQPNREISEIEEHILAEITKIVMTELQSVWQQVGVSLANCQRHSGPQLQRLLSPIEKVIVLSFELSILSIKGTMNLLVPLSVVNGALRKMNQDWSYRPTRRKTGSGEQIVEKLLNCSFTLELGLTEVLVPVRDFLALQPGSVLKLNLPVQTPPSLLAGSRTIFEASAVRRGTNRAAQLQEAVRRREITSVSKRKFTPSSGIQ